MKRPQNLFRWFSLGLTLSGFAAANEAAAQSYWTAPGSGNWGDSLNWLGGAPTIELAAAITNAASKLITVNAATPTANRAARRLDLNAPAGSTNTLRLDDLGDTPFTLANSLTLGAGSRIEVVNSVLQLDGSEGGNFNQFAGEVVLVSGTILTTNVAVPATNGLPALRIGRSGTGQAVVLGGTLRAFDQLVIADLSGSLGTLTLSNGLVSVGGILNLANNPGATGRVDIYGGHLTATNDTARIGDDGDGAFTQYAGTVILDSVSVGRSSNSTGRIHLQGGILSPGSVSLGRFASASGTLEVSGGTLDMATKTLYVGREGAGLAVFSSGMAWVESVLIAASNSASGNLQMRGGSLTTGQLLADKVSAQIEFSTGTLVVTQATTIANGAPFVIGNGVQAATLQLDGGTHVFANGLVVSANATIKGNGTVVGNITVLPGGSNQLGQSAAVSLAPVMINGRFTISFPSAIGKSYDVLAATSPAALVWELQSTLAGTGTTLTYTNTSSEERRFFRVSTH